MNVYTTETNIEGSRQQESTSGPDLLPGQNLQHSPGTANCCAAGQLSAGHMVSGSMRLQCIEPSRHSHSTHCLSATDSPWS